jgi:hypothetical protein
MAADKADAFCREIKEIDGEEAWVIGRVVEATDQQKQTRDPKQNECRFVDDIRVIEV